MREGRRRPSLGDKENRWETIYAAAMREGRRRPSLGRSPHQRRLVQTGRNEGGAPAPLVGGLISPG